MTGSPFDPPPYPFVGRPCVHAILRHEPVAYAQEIALATISTHKAADKWQRVGASDGCVFAEAWHGDGVVEYAEWSRHTGLRTRRAP